MTRSIRLRKKPWKVWKSIYRDDRTFTDAAYIGWNTFLNNRGHFCPDSSDFVANLISGGKKDCRTDKEDWSNNATFSLQAFLLYSCLHGHFFVGPTQVWFGIVTLLPPPSSPSYLAPSPLIHVLHPTLHPPLKKVRRKTRQVFITQSPTCSSFVQLGFPYSATPLKNNRWCSATGMWT